MGKNITKTYIIASAEGNNNSLKLKLEVETTDTAQRRSVMTLVDSGVTGECIDQDYVKSCGFKLIKLTQPIPVYNVDGTLNNDGSITKVVSLILHYKKNHFGSHWPRWAKIITWAFLAPET